MPDPVYKSDPAIGIVASTGDRLVGAGVRNSSGNYDLLTLDASGFLKVNVAGGTSSTQYAVGTAAGATDLGNVGLYIRDDSLSTLSDPEGDYVPARTDSIGNLWVSLGTRLDKTNDAISVYGNTIKDGSGTAYALLVDNDGQLQVDVLTNALPTGAATLAEQQTQTASLSVLDDWDETDRAKVNIIVGQAGVQGGSGTVSANTQRVVLATDVALPAGTNNIGDVDVLTLPARTYSKTAGADLLALQSVAASSVTVSAAIDVSAKASGLIYVRFGRQAATAAGAGANIRLEASFSASLNNSWFPFAVFTTAFAAAADEPVSGTVAAGATVITVAATAGFTAGDIIFINNGTIANSEWCRIKSIVANTSVTVEDALVNAATGATIYDSAEIYSPIAIPDGAIRIRAVADGSGFTQAFAIQIEYSLINSMVNA